MYTRYIQGFKILASFCSWAGWFEYYLVEVAEDTFSHDVAHLELRGLVRSFTKYTMSTKNMDTRKVAVTILNFEQCGFTIGATSWENLIMPYANNKDADQPAHPRSPISTFIVHCINSVIPPISIPKISSLYLASVAAQVGLSLPWSQTPKTGFLVTRDRVELPLALPLHTFWRSN